MVTKYAILIIALPLLAAFLIPLLDMVNKKIPKFIPVIVMAFNSFLTIGFLAHLIKTNKPIIVTLGGFLPPFGINLTIGYLSTILLILISVVGLVVSIYSLTEKDVEYRYYMLSILLLMGLSGLVTTGDIFNMFVFLEITSIAAYSLTAYKGDGLSLEAAMKYILIGSLASAFILIGLGVLYYAGHSLNMADIAKNINKMPTDMKMFAVAMLFVGLAIEAEMFPLNGWVPDVYQATKTPVTTLFSAIVVKATIYMMFRVLITVFQVDAHIMNFVMIIGLITLLMGEISALKQTNIKRMLAYSSIGQVGLIVVAIASMSTIGISGGLYQMINHAIFKVILFLGTGYMVTSVMGKGNIEELRGIAKKMPITAFILSFTIIALLGVPPLAGFWAKMMIIGGVISKGHTTVAALVLVATIIEAVYYLKFIAIMYDTKEEAQESTFKSTLTINKMIPILTFVIFILMFSVVSALPLFQRIMLKAANEFTNVGSYISAVLGG